MKSNDNKYWVEYSGVLSEAEKVQFAKDLLELERQGVLEYRAGTWGLAAGAEIEETSNGPVARFRRMDDGTGQSAASSTPSSGEPSVTRVPPLEQAARPSSQGPGSPDSDDEVSNR